MRRDLQNSSQSRHGGLLSASSNTKEVTTQVVKGSPMRILAISDIHNNIGAVCQMWAHEQDTFDVVVVAGDLGDESAQEVFDLLNSFACPVLYVFGNWDQKIEYDTVFGKNCTHLHLQPRTIDGLLFVRFSGVPAGWGKNPIAAMVRREVAERHRPLLDEYEFLSEAAARDEAKLDTECSRRLSRLAARVGDRRRREYQVRALELERKRSRQVDRVWARARAIQELSEYRAYTEDQSAARAQISVMNRLALVRAIDEMGGEANRTIVVTHERLTRTSTDLQETAMFLFGHQHGFYDRRHVGSRFVNVSVLDKRVTVEKATKASANRGSVWNVNGGNYIVIEGTDPAEMRVLSVGLSPNVDNYVRLPFVVVDAPFAT